MGAALGRLEGRFVVACVMKRSAIAVWFHAAEGISDESTSAVEMSGSVMLDLRLRIASRGART